MKVTILNTYFKFMTINTCVYFTTLFGSLICVDTSITMTFNCSINSTLNTMSRSFPLSPMNYMNYKEYLEIEGCNSAYYDNSTITIALSTLLVYQFLVEINKTNVEDILQDPGDLWEYVLMGVDLLGSAMNMALTDLCNEGWITDISAVRSVITLVETVCS